MHGLKTIHLPHALLRETGEDRSLFVGRRLVEEHSVQFLSRALEPTEAHLHYIAISPRTYLPSSLNDISKD